MLRSLMLRQCSCSALLPLVLCAGLALAASLEAGTVRMHGAVTLDKLLRAQQAAIESQTGATLELLGNSSGRGLADLSSGSADVALIGAPLKGVAEAMNAEKPGSVNTAGMSEIPVTNIKLAFITHPSAGVKSLTTAQVRDVFSGKITNWKQAGGADVPVKLVMPFPGDGARITVRETLLQGGGFPKDMIQRNGANDLCVVVAQLPGACTILSPKNIQGAVARVALEQDVVMPMLFIVKGAPAGEIKKVVDAALPLLK